MPRPRSVQRYGLLRCMAARHEGRRIPCEIPRTENGSLVYASHGESEPERGVAIIRSEVVLLAKRSLELWDEMI
ncbi:hypothetical protein Tco_1430593 [Tanacetum coccineum]